MAKRKQSSRDRLRKVQTVLYLEPDQFARLKRVNEQTGIPMQVVLRQGLEMVLAAKYGEMQK